MSETAIDRKPPTGEGLTFEKVWAMFQETDRRMQETDRRMQKTDRQIKKVSKQMGGLNNSFGQLAEHLVAPGIAERFNELGYTFDGICQRGLIILNEKGKPKAEIDILLENSECIVAVEVKSKAKENDIERHVRRLQILRENRDKHKDSRKVRGAIASAVFLPGIKEEVLEAGFYVIEQSGDTMRIDVPEDFTPREW